MENMIDKVINLPETLNHYISSTKLKLRHKIRELTTEYERLISQSCTLESGVRKEKHLASGKIFERSK